MKSVHSDSSQHLSVFGDKDAPFFQVQGSTSCMRVLTSASREKGEFRESFFLLFLFLSALGLRCCGQGFSSCGERGLLFIAVCRLLIMVASLVVEHGL